MGADYGKEEDILFEALTAKDLSPDHSSIMQELIGEHVYARKIVGELVEANKRYRQGDRDALPMISGKIADLVNLYPDHIFKEDEGFFPAAMEYLDRAEQDRMLQVMWDFDRGMIHEKYRSIVDRLERREGYNE